MSNTEESQRKLKIAYGNGRESKKWRNGEITWDEMCEKLRSTYRTRETVEEYQHMSSDERSAAKDNGAFVGGHLRDGRRRVEDVECRSFLTLDADYSQSDFIERFTNECKYAAALYSTHSHTSEKPRLRIVMPLKEDVSPDCYVALSRFLAATWDIELFDKCSFSVNQPMFWPTTPSDGEFVSRIITGPFLDALEFLKDYPDWRDPTTLPKNSHEKPIRVTGKKQEDPLQKEGIVGTFCRTYSIEDAIRKYLPDIY